MINVLERITQLRVERGWSEYQLAVKSELTQSTISSWYRKNMLPTVPSIQKICDAFGITVSQFFIDEKDDVTTITAQQRRMLAYCAKLDSSQIDALLDFLDRL